MTELHNLKPSHGSHRNRKRVGRGPGSGTGKTSGRGQKGQKARSGASIPAGFEGGQMPLQRRIPKVGFTPLNRVAFQVINVRALEELQEDEITPQVLMAHGLIGSLKEPVKILGTGEISRTVSVRAHAFSASARAKIQAAGGSVSIVGDKA
ncbi:MAG: 50S ribosomal protein L15 [Gemmatimonadales bacterium]|jgi:large subunit ribosomal protein L15|nr:MAG: 50S ribosomal protein L15 [Gemmatimonadales bacterium]